jgi:peptide/nickel transport system ATP-binding protein
MTEQTILKIEDLKLRFYTYEGIVEALDGVDLEIKPGEILGLVGETGCGKSVTSLSVLQIVPSPGAIEGGKILYNYDGKIIDLTRQKDEMLRRIRGSEISMIFQEPRAYLNPVYTVEDQIGEVLLIHRKKELIQKALEKIRRERERKQKTEKSFAEKVYERMLQNPNSLYVRFLSKIPIVNRFKKWLKLVVREEVVNILKAMQIADPARVAQMYPHELSGGMAQRVMIAMALSCNPTLLICDEPTTNLDVTVQAQILELISYLKESFKSSILYITHDLGVVAQLCDRVAIMYAGNIVELADVHTIFKKPLHPYAIALLDSIPRPGKEFKSIPGTVPTLINPPSGCRFHTRCSYAMPICENVKPQFLEVEKDHFVACHLYGGSKK